MEQELIFRASVPFPVSTNRYWRAIKRRAFASVIVSEAGREYRASVKAALMLAGVAPTGTPRFPAPTRLAVEVDLYPPDLRRRDLDNFAGKALLDCLTKANLWSDDSQIDRLTITRRPVVKGGLAMIRVAVM